MAGTVRGADVLHGTAVTVPAIVTVEQQTRTRTGIRSTYVTPTDYC